ncbi:hypothetical protein [Roseibium sediminicola]|uniref:HlyD family secretion protein n=1 Tax=Roseibium sediminicola TaxID=2933272 RepID=A0ABT0GXJ7_9HYPH|nr:hypothetical protein [Roseibium sp. CAU 1639]MCK7614165.1 hypothetical protein [Roseibium sp. CAU 1639]
MKAEDLNPMLNAGEPNTQHAASGQPGDQDNEHALIELPFVVVIEGRQYEGSAISLVNAFVTGLAALEIGSNSRIAVFRFPFNGFSVSLPIDVRIETVDRTTGLYKLVFLHPTGPHLPQLRYLLNAFIAGDIVNLDDLMRVPPEKSAKAKAGGGEAAFSLSRLFKRAAGAVFVTAASLGLLAAISYGLQNRLFVHEVPALAIVEPIGLSLQTPEAGQLAYVNAEAAKGEVVFSIQTVRGSVLSVENPCDCEVILTDQGVVGATVFQAAPIAFVSSGTEAPVLKARVPDRLAKMLLNGALAEAKLPDGRSLTMALDDVRQAGQSGDPESIVTLRPETGQLTNADVSSSVAVKVLNRNYVDLKAWATSLWETVKKSVTQA